MHLTNFLQWELHHIFGEAIQYFRKHSDNYGWKLFLCTFIAFKDLRPISWPLNSSYFSNLFFFFERQGDKERQRDGKIDRCLICWLTSQTAQQPGLCQVEAKSQELHPSSHASGKGPSTWASMYCLLGCTLAGSWIRSKVPDMGWRQQLTLPAPHWFILHFVAHYHHL